MSSRPLARCAPAPGRRAATGPARRLLAGAAALLLSTPALGATVTWTFSGVLDSVLDAGGHTTLADGGAFTGRIHFDTEAADSRNFFGFLGIHRFGAPYGLEIDLGDGFVATADPDADVTLQQNVTNFLFTRDRVTFAVPEVGAVDAFGTTFLADGANAVTLALSGDADWVGGADVVPEPAAALDSATLTLRFFETLTGDALQLSATVASFDPVVYGTDGGAAPVPLPGTLGTTLAAGLALLYLARRRSAAPGPAGAAAAA
jgi:hypothetical protein